MGSDRLSRKTITQTMTIDAVLAHLAASEVVDGVALRGSRMLQPSDQSTDYDLLVLVTERPLHIIQLFTHVEQRVADVFLMDVKAYDQVIKGDRQLSSSSPDGIFMRKLANAEIIYDRSGRIQRGLEAASNGPGWFKVASYSALYLLWFTQNFVLAHMKRMMHSTDPTYLTGVDMLMVSSLGATYRAYFEVRRLSWEGEKGAIRYLQDHDPKYLEVLRSCLKSGNREQKLLLYEELVTLALEPFGEVWNDDIVAVCFDAPLHDFSGVDKALSFWEDLFT